MACLAYQPSTLYYDSKEYTRVDLINKRIETFEKAFDEGRFSRIRLEKSIQAILRSPRKMHYKRSLSPKPKIKV